MTNTVRNWAIAAEQYKVASELLRTAEKAIIHEFREMMWELYHLSVSPYALDQYKIVEDRHGVKYRLNSFNEVWNTTINNYHDIDGNWQFNVTRITKTGKEDKRGNTYVVFRDLKQFDN